MRSSTEVCLRNCASAVGSRDSSSKRKYSDTNRSSPVKPAALAELGAPACIESAARYRPAGQPSVRSVSSESSLGVELDAGRFSSSSASCSSSRRSATPISCSTAVRPPAGERQRGLLSARDRDLRAGRDVLEQRGEHVQAGRIGDGVQIVEHEHQRVARAPPARSRGAGRASTRRIRPGPTARRTPRAGSARRGGWRPRCSAGTPRRRRRGRRARPTRTDADPPRPNCARSVVLPYPAGATTVTNGRATRTAARSRPLFATVPGRVERRGELDLRRGRKASPRRPSRGQSYGGRTPGLDSPGVRCVGRLASSATSRRRGTACRAGTRRSRTGRTRRSTRTACCPSRQAPRSRRYRQRRCR